MPNTTCPNCNVTVAVGRFCSNCAGPLEVQPVSAPDEPRSTQQQWPPQPTRMPLPPSVPKGDVTWGEAFRPFLNLWRGLSPKAKGWTIAIALVFIFYIIVNSGNKKTGQPSAPPSNQPTSAQPASVSPPPPQATVSDAPMHLAEAKKSLAYNYHPKGENKSWGRVDEARGHLELIPREAKEYADAQKLLAEVKRREADIAAWSKIAARELYATTLEQTYLQKGMDVTVTVSGPDKATIKLKYVLMSRPIVYQMMTDADVVSTLRSGGFKKIIFTDGYFHTWNQDL